MSEFPLHPVPETWQKNAYIDNARYLAMYQQSISNPDGFWAEQAEQFLSWEKKWHSVCQADLSKGEAQEIKEIQEVEKSVQIRLCNYSMLCRA